MNWGLNRPYFSGGMDEPLRVCPHCGREAWTEEDLIFFMKNKHSRHGVMNVCRRCNYKHHRAWVEANRDAYREMKRRWIEKHPEARIRSRDWKRRRQLKLIEGFDKPLRCYFCVGVITRLEGHARGALNVHSLDWNHENWDLSNKVPAHVGCHVSYHKTRALQGQVGLGVFNPEQTP